MKFRAKKVQWIGVYKKVVFFGQQSRILEAVVPDKSEATKWVESKCSEKWSPVKSSDFMLEPVDVKMQAWDPSRT